MQKILMFPMSYLGIKTFSRFNPKPWKKKKSYKLQLPVTLRNFFAPPITRSCSTSQSFRSALNTMFPKKSVWIQLNCVLFLKFFFHCNKFEIFFSNLKIVITDFFKPVFFVKIYCPLVAVKHGKPDFIKIQLFGFF